MTDMGGANPSYIGSEMVEKSERGPEATASKTDSEASSDPAVGFVVEPRALATQKKAFGISTIPLTPVDKKRATGPRWRATELQHQVANAVRESLASEGTNLRAWVTKNEDQLPAGLSYDRLVRIQRGETLMQIADLFHWAAVFPRVASLLREHSFDPLSEPSQAVPDGSISSEARSASE
ncbi:hypothetical protein [Marisediminicola sp. LYQ85]|uniref:hypothetical protein n=1 Tax=Marisediminicola sp. LYQ85 TaxID=3391062 RepID=UPI0039838EE1